MDQVRFLTVVMYHYVRDLPRTRYPAIKGLCTAGFISQLDYIQEHYTVVSPRECVNAYSWGTGLPENPLLLTFDDGFLDHYLTVFPLLHERNIAGVFFPPGRAILERQLLGAHKIHFILARTNDYSQLVSLVYAALSKFRDTHELPSDDTLYLRLAGGSRFDSPEVTFIKKLLQRELPKDIRADIINELFTSVVEDDERILANELYMTVEQLKVMASNGMCIGGHGYNHDWIGHLSDDEQKEEIRLTVNFLTNVYGHEPHDWIMAYPYGDYSELQAQLLKQHKCSLAFASDVGITPVKPEIRFRLPRLDTNDLPLKIACGRSGFRK